LKRRPWLAYAPVVLLGALVAPIAPTLTTAAQAAPTSAATSADTLPDPTVRGSEHIATIQETKLGVAALQEPNSSGAAATAGTAQAAESLEVRGSLYYPDQRTEKSPLIVLVHGNHGSCDAGQDSTTATCTQYKRNEAGYAYLGENLASWGYTVFSLSQDQLMMRQDNNKGKGMHQRRLLIAAALDALGKASSTGLTNDAHTTLGTTLLGKLDMTRIGLMGHSRGGDVVSSYVDYNRTRTDGPRYNLRGVIALAPVDYERKAPSGVPYMTILPTCDGDVSNMQGARMFERSQYINGNDPFPKIQVTHLGGIHNWYNTVWYADGSADGQASNDAACGNSAPFATNNVHPNNLRLSGAASYTDDSKNYKVDNSSTYDPAVNTKISGAVERMGDQETLGLATMAAFFRRYVGGEGAFDAYMTGELSDTASHQQVPTSACPTSTSGKAIACSERVNTTYFAPSADRVDVIRPEIENPLTLNALGGSLSGSGFADPYAQSDGTAKTAATAGGYDWCNPEPDDFAPSQLGKGTLPTAEKACPLPAASALGGQSGTRENSPINHSYGRQLTLAWEKDSTATLAAQIPAAKKDVSNLKALVLDADVNFWDTRNPGADNRGDNTRVTTGTFNGVDCTTALPCWTNEKPVSYNPAASTQDFLIKVTDTAGKTATVHAGDERWGNALHASTGTNTPTTHVVLEQIRVPLTEFTAQGVDISSLAQVGFEFGATGTPAEGSIQMSDVRFQETATQASDILSDGATKADGPGVGNATTANPITAIEAFTVAKGQMKLIDNVGHEFNNTTWTVDDDGVQCPNANFTSIQDAVDFASPWDTIVVCDGTYEESSTPISHASNPVATGATNGLTITKPLKIKGAGADKVTIMPKQSLDTLAGLKPYLRDGGGNIITVSRQSLGSTDTNEMFVDISGVTVTGGSTFAEAGIAFFGAAGRVSESVVGPFRTAKTADELAENPHGYGIVKTSLIKGAGAGTVENEVTVANSVVKGYQTAGILFDGGSGKDGAADNQVRTGTKQHGYVTKSVITGSRSKLYPQTGVIYTNGVDGLVDDSRISNNYYAANPATSYGVLLADAGTDAGALTGARDSITGNGYAIYNATADRTTVRSGSATAFKLSGSYLGTATVTGGVGDPEAGSEGISGSSSVTVSSAASGVLGTVPTGVGAIADAKPTAALVSPLSGVTTKVGATVYPIARGRDDFAVASAQLLVNGNAVATATQSPYSFAFTPGTEYAGKTVKLTTVITDSSGQRTTSAPVDVVVAKAATSGGGKVPTTVVTLKPTVKVAKVVKQTKKGTAAVVVATNGRGTVTVSGAKVVTSKKATSSTVTIKLKLKASARKTLAKKGKVAVKVKVSYTAASGGTATAVRTITVIKKR
jgi:large repetitive protein